MISNKLKPSSNAGCQPAKPNPALRRAIADQLFSGCQLDWLTDTVAYLPCPGETMHTTGNGRRHCRLTLDGAPNLYCFHASCFDIVDGVSYALQRMIGAAESGASQTGIRIEPRPRSERPEDIAKAALIAQGQAYFATVMGARKWAACDFYETTPAPLPDDPREQWGAFLGLFAPDDIVWMGEKTDTGYEKKSSHFRTVKDWQGARNTLRQFTSPSTFKPGTFARKNENVAHRRFLVVESDHPDIDKDAFASIVGWLRDDMGMDLAAVVDTAGKSLHAWVRYPGDEQTAVLSIILPAMGCDPKMFTASQPARLPGAERKDADGKRTGAIQSLLYLDPSKGVAL